MYTRLAANNSNHAVMAVTGNISNSGKPCRITARRCSAPCAAYAITEMKDSSGGSATATDTISSVLAAQQNQLKLRIRRSLDQQFQAEHRVTVTVCAIVTCFTLTQGPSAIVLLMSFLSNSRTGNDFFGANFQSVLHYMNSLTGFLVIFGKTLNFILFCLSSQRFRRRLATIIRRKFHFLIKFFHARTPSAKSLGGTSTAESSLRLKQQQQQHQERKTATVALMVKQNSADNERRASAI